MARIVLILFALLLVCLAAPGEVLAQLDPTEFSNVNGTSWFALDNWSNGVPNATKHAIILANQECHIPTGGSNATAGALTIEEDATLEIEEERTLTLGVQDEMHSSVIEDGGLLQIADSGASNNATLKIAGDHTIAGDGGVILLFAKSEILDNGDEDDFLTIDGVAGNRSASLLVTGTDGLISVPLFNNAFVVASGGKQTSLGLCLKDDPMDSGCDGHWIAEADGQLSVLTFVEGDGRWLTQDSDLALLSGGTIVIGDGTGGDGCVVSDGELVVTGDASVFNVTPYGRFCTTNKMTHRSMDTGLVITTPTISSSQASYFAVTVCSSTYCP